MNNSCGNCNMCCKITCVPELKKPVNAWCSFCTIGKGCEVYERRPPTCRNYICLWLSDSLPDNLRPDKCKVIFEPFTDGIYLALCDESRPDAWKAPVVRKTIMQIVKSGKVIFTKKNIFLPEGRNKDDVMTEFNKRVRELELGGSIIR